MRKLMARWQAWRDGRQFVVVGTQSHWPIWRGAESNGAAMTEIGLRADGVGARPVAPAWLAYGLSLSPNWPGLRLRSLLQRIDMTRFVLELKGPAEGDLATLGRAQSKPSCCHGAQKERAIEIALG